jgi:glutamate-ammonia-ligase adenylyltransferase
MTEYQSLYESTRQDVENLLPALDSPTSQSVARVCAISEYFHKNLLRDPTEIASLFESGDMVRSYPIDGWNLPPMTIDTLDADLRRIRRREMCRIIYRDLTRTADLIETTRDLSNLADAALDAALALHYEKNCERWGTPVGAVSGKPQQMTVLALGKLGARELNLSSDIDLIFFYDEAGTLAGEGARDLSNQEFFVRTSRDVIASLDQSTSDGFVFRVDMRLRPYGDSGALILHRSAMEKYFIEQGRDWERYAFIKARACAGDVAQGEDFLTWLSPFVFRRHLDFGAIDSLRELKRLINYEVEVKELSDNLKLGHGGIREVEFIVQALQIIWGGKEPELREPRLLDVLEKLEADGKLPSEDAVRLRDAYHFLRDSEHVLQAEADRQTQQLPVTDLSRERLAIGMGFEEWDEYLALLDEHRRSASRIFEAFMTSNSAERETLVEGNMFWVSIWREPESEDSLRLLEGAGFEDAAGTARRIGEFEGHLEESDVQEIGSLRIDRLMPVLLSLASKEENPDATLERVLSIIDSIARRSTYVAFLLENLDALKRTVQLCAMSPWVSEQLQRFPILLYELSDTVTEETVFDGQRLFEEMQQLLVNLDHDDLESQMDGLRQFKNSAVLKVAVFELLSLLPIMKASDALTNVAEILLQRAFELAWQYLVHRHGTPCDQKGAAGDSAFAIIAYGKLGGIELGYGSDLDIVFLHDADLRGRTNGERSIENSVFYLRLGQRIVHILTSFTRFGVLYEADMRLRPDGNKGPLVSTLASYERYLKEKAWTWEHQALVRARYVAGDEKMRGHFERIRSEVLSINRERSKLLEDVVSMREKMRLHLDKDAKSKDVEEGADEVLVSGFDLKQGAGAIVDIEFLVQFVVLAHSCEHAVLTRWTDKMRILDEIRELGLLSGEDIDLLQEAYLAYRSAVHYQWLGGDVATLARLQQYREDVVKIWSRELLYTGVS